MDTRDWAYVAAMVAFYLTGFLVSVAAVVYLGVVLLS